MGLAGLQIKFAGDGGGDSELRPGQCPYSRCGEDRIDWHHGRESSQSWEQSSTGEVAGLPMAT